MRILLSGSLLGGSFTSAIAVDIKPYTILVTDAALAVSLVQVGVFGPVTKGNLAYLRNSSAGGQNIRIGTAPDFTAGSENGLLMEPGDGVVIVDLNTAVNAIADAAGGLLDRLVYTKA